MKRRTLGLVLTLALALMLLTSCLAGFTVAWFTDLEASLNSIRAGSLDVEMNYHRVGEAGWKRVEINTPLFDQENLHVPGCAQVVFLQAENAGDLALKFQLGVTAANAVIGRNEQGEEIRLTRYLKAGAWRLGEDSGLSEADFDTREKLLQRIAESPDNMHPLRDYDAPETDAAEKALILLEGCLGVSPEKLPAGSAAAETASTETIALVLHLPLEVDNEANYRGANRPKAAIGVHLLAAQLTAEADSFDEQYDVNAVYPDYSAPLSLLAEMQSGDGDASPETGADSE